MTSAPLAPPALLPVRADARLSSVDTLRGVAVLGILVMNITSFALPPAAYLNPMSVGLAPYQGEFTGINRIIWWVQYIVFDMKMMTIFSMLFGAGLVLMDSRAAARRSEMTPDGAGPDGQPKASFVAIYYRRILALGIIGLIHGYLIWFGDILFVYALCGLALYPVRRWRARTLMITGGVILFIGCVIWSLFGVMMVYMRDQALEAQAAVAAGKPVAEHLEGMAGAWKGVLAGFDPTPEQAAAQVATMRGSVGQVLAANAMETLQMHIWVIPTFFVWRTVGVMLIGMALMKLGVFSAERSNRYYATLALVGYGLGIPVLVLGGRLLIATRFDPADWYLYTGQFNAVGSLLVALAHVGVVMLVCRSGALKAVRSRLASVGRMAFTNYLTQSLICTTVFFGWGLGYFAALDRAWLMVFVAGVWTLQLLWSPWWLARFRFGPAEWLWRSLTYLKRQPMRLRS